jgi:hypothetical protein
MTREELLALPRADQSKSLIEWDKVLLVPTDETYWDNKSWRIFAVIGMTMRHGVLQATHLITEGDIIDWVSSNITPHIDMLADYDNSIGIFNQTYHLQVYGGGGTIFIKFVQPSSYRSL